MVMDCRVAAVTVRVRMFDVIPLCAALMFVVPTVAPVAKPVGLIVAIDVLDEVQVSEFVRF